MKQFTQINESKPKGEWCLWDYEENQVKEILIWKGNGRDQSSVEEIDSNGVEIMNASLEDVISYCKEHKDEVDKVHLDISNAKLEKIESIFNETFK